jgi:cell division protein FtsB
MLYKKLSMSSITLTVLLLLLLIVHLSIWDSATGFFHLFELRKVTDEQLNLNIKIKQENKKMAVKVMSIKKKPEMLERAARENLGMISKHEKFFQLANKN